MDGSRPGGPGQRWPWADEHSLAERFESLRHLIGDTPLIEIRARWRGVECRVFAKHEAGNFTGSIKDRMALHILEEAHARGEVRPGDRILEASSGNTGIAIAGIGRALGHPVRIYMPDWMSRERLLLMQGMGAEVVGVSREDGGFIGSIEQAEAEARRCGDAFLPRQFANLANIAAHRCTTGPEILLQMRDAGHEPEAFVAGVGTGGTVMGVGAFLRDRVPGLTVHPLEPANSPTLRTGKRNGVHRIQGISDEFIPEIVDLESLDSLVDVWDGDAILMAQRLAGQLGLALGISSGANLLGAIQVAAERGNGSAVATVFPDCNKKYLSTDLCRDEPARDDYLTPEVDLLGVCVHPRLGVARITEAAARAVTDETRAESNSRPAGSS